MKVLTKNVKIFFDCVGTCTNIETTRTDILDLIESGNPICPVCGEQMELSDECLVTN